MEHEAKQLTFNNSGYNWLVLLYMKWGFFCFLKYLYYLYEVEIIIPFF